MRMIGTIHAAQATSAPMARPSTTVCRVLLM
jgi:hypothetical protein